MFDVLLCVFVVLIFTFVRKLLRQTVTDTMEELQQEMHKLRLQLELEQNMSQEKDEVIKSLESEKEQKGHVVNTIKKKYDVQVTELNDKIDEQQSRIQQLEKVIKNFEQKVNFEEVEENIIIPVADTSEELLRLRVENSELHLTCDDLQKTVEDLQLLLTNTREELLSQISELKSKLTLKEECYNMFVDKYEGLQEENILMKAEIGALKGKLDSHSSKGNSLFAEVEDNRQQLKDELKRIKQKYLMLKKTLAESLSELTKLRKEKASLCQELAQAKEEQRFNEEVQLQFTAYKERIKDLEAAQKAWEEEKDAEPIVLGSNSQTVKLFEHLQKEKREELRKLNDRYDEIMMRYIRIGDEVVAAKRETALMESKKLRAEAEIAQLKMELQKYLEDGHKIDDPKEVERSPLKDIQNKKKCRFAPDTFEPSSRKLVAKKKAENITYLTS